MKFKFMFMSFNFLIDFFHNYTYLLCKTLPFYCTNQKKILQGYFYFGFVVSKVNGRLIPCIWLLCIAAFLICCFGQYVCLQLQYAHGLDLYMEMLRSYKASCSFCIKCNLYLMSL